ncbi:hypothetical protein WJX75_002233 [Coccomyxa subellipsoidea]|uniref:Protein kinase domain-containing protein n=1 Tax=Coccomyxa subellipsoidea TaxID=248742 RepID=A0ABR2YGC0_9CHLO
MTSMHLVTFIVFTLVHVSTTQSTPGDTRLVSSAQELGGALRNESVLNVIIKGKIRLSKENWVNGGTAFINNNRHVVLQSDQEAPASAVLDLGTLVDAIHVAAGSHLELRRLRIPNSGNRRLTRPSERVRLRVAGIFALWPSVTLAKDSQMSFSDSVFYYWSDKEWDSCDKFRDVATNILNPRGVPDMLEWSASDTQVYIRGSQNTSQALVNMINKKVHVGAFNTTRTNHTLVCLPDPFQDESSGFVSPLAVFGVLATLAAAVAIAQYFGLIRLLPAPAAPPHSYMMGSQSSGEVRTSVHGSASHYHSSAGSHPSRGAEEHISGLVRDRQRATIGGLELGEMLGRGSFGKVYKGRWRGAIVAVKIVAHDCSLASLAETLRESALSTSIQHPNVVTTFKVRTVRSTHGSNDPSSAAATWAQGEENGLDAASGDSGRLLMRAMSVGPGRGGRVQPLNRSSLATMVSPLRNSALNTPEKLLSRADSGTGSMLEGVQEEDEEPEPLSMAIKDEEGAWEDNAEPLSMSYKAGIARPPRMPYTDLRNKGPSPDRPVMPPLPGGTEGSGGMSGAALLTPTDSERGSAGGNPAAQMQQAAEKGADLLETWLILEFCDQGSFDHAIRAGRYIDNLPNGVLCLMDIAAGMEHLHSLGVLHADLKGANVLLKSAAVSNYDSRGYSCKLADFGLSRVMENNSTHVSTSTFGTAAYMPAELLMEGKMTRAADVYSFSMLMFELLIGAQLFEGMRQSQIICKVITGWRPSVPDDSHPSFVALMTDCWHVDMTQRPVFSDILQRLRALYRELRMAAG